MNNLKLEGTNQLFLNAKKKIYIKDFTVDGSKGTTLNTNAKILFDAEEFVVKNTEIKNGCTAYNVFEQKGAVKYPIKSLKLDGINCDDVALTHNIASIYNLADNATIVIKNSTFNLNVNNSNIIRLANYLNAKNVNVLFQDCEWNYENSPEGADWAWAGLVLFQPAGADKALTGDYTDLKTWKFTFENCKYNGVKVRSNNFGEHNQVIYLYNMNKDGKLVDPCSTEFGLNIEFK